MGLARTSIVQAVYCLQCGGPVDEKSAAARRCAYCHAPLVPLDHPDPRTSFPCGRCAAPVTMGSKYCGHCGHAARAQKEPSSVLHACPGCGHAHMHRWELDGEGHTMKIAVCSQCGGSFVDHDTMQELVARESARFESSIASLEPRLDGVKRFTIPANATIEHRDCPLCHQRMARRNYGRLSGVIVDQCREHGAFFDAGELAQVLAFVRSGGLVVDRARQAKSKQREAKVRAELAMAKMDGRLALRGEVEGPASVDIVGVLLWLRDALGWIFRLLRQR